MMLVTPALIPQPQQCTVLDRPPFTLTADTALHAPPALAHAAEQLAARLRFATGWKFPVLAAAADHTPSPAAIVFVASAHIAHPEGYSLRVTSEGALITAAADAGAFYAAQTLLQLFPPAVFDSAPRPDLAWTAPAIEISDAPRFRWRGVMVDSARFFQPIAALKKFVDVLSQHKFNVFHWHLVDDQGWRIEIKKYPQLTAVGSQRRETVRGHSALNLGGDNAPVAGFYTQEEIRDFVAYAAARHIHVLPEIEMPGHAQAAVASYPELGLLAQPRDVSCTWGIHETLFNTKPATFAFLQDVLTEVIALFPFEYLHIGGDEAVKKQWQDDPATQAHLKSLGLPDEEHLQSWFIQQIETFLAARGRKLVGWDEILEGGLAKTATVMSWRGTEGAIAAARHGNDAIMCPNPFVYFDHYQTDTPGTEPLGIGGNSPLAKVHGYEPIPAELSAAQARSIIGVQGQLWTEYIPTSARLEFMAFPRACALAEVAWSEKSRPDFAHFLARLCTHLRRLDVQDVRYRAPLEYVRA
ncbi:beta-N-acetylhexosaminidase [Horticoccus luteus]|uniref:beta-N-acetylhexosaminidase n=1 Tax=Horticoccus luteus TaxID=2862869 RepID=A0A8F9XMF2_9BACT|nr:beta-N-acetylhexosaminidase [Horticoccus luteus]QYM79974.1 beta-N-acetylhexosaminidase [Horticoccus luteus]